MSPLLRTLTIICAVGAATAAGTFFTFSNFTMKGLKRLPPSQGASAMQAINREAPSPLFMTLLFGTGAALGVLGVRAAMNLDDPAATCSTPSTLPAPRGWPTGAPIYGSGWR
jgi:uncharacterized membrane protein